MSEPRHYGAMAVAIALELWVKRKMRVKAAWTPGVMMRAAESYTGEKFRARDYAGAARKLRELVELSRKTVV